MEERNNPKKLKQMGCGNEAMKKIYLKVIFIILLMNLLILCSCYYAQEKAYYADKENFVNVTGTVKHIKYNENETMLYLGFSDLSQKFADNTFKIVGENLVIAQENGIDEKLEMGDQIEFITAPGYFGDGYVMPIVSITIDGETLLEFDEGYENFMELYE